MRRFLVVSFAVLVAGRAQATDLAAKSGWSSLAGDRSAHAVGDVLTVVIYENATATNTAENRASKNSTFAGQLSIGTPSTGSNVVDGAASLGLSHGADNQGATARAGQMVAQISVTVDSVYPNGDLHVAGAQALKINGENTNIRLRGRVRLADITPANAVLSSSLADASIDYDGQGFVTSSSEPGVLTRLFNWLGIP